MLDASRELCHWATDHVITRVNELLLARQAHRGEFPCHYWPIICDYFGGHHVLQPVQKKDPIVIFELSLKQELCVRIDVSI